MNIQTISFTAKQRYEYHRPHIPVNAPKQEKEQIDINDMAKQAQNALNTVPYIQNASNQFKKDSSKILYQADKIQQKSEEIMAEIIDTSAFNHYLGRNKHMPFYDTYATQIELKDGLYDVKIKEHQILATKTTGDSKDIYVFDTTDRSLTSHIKNQRKIGQTTTAEAEYFFDGNEGLSQCNFDVSRGDFELISKRFKFNTNRKTNTLSSVSTMVKRTLSNESAERIFEYNQNGQLTRYIRDFKENLDCVVSVDLLYEFIDNELSTFKKGSIEAENYSSAKLYAEFMNKDNFYVQANYNADKTPEYDAICYYQNGKVEGSVV